MLAFLEIDKKEQDTESKATIKSNTSKQTSASKAIKNNCNFDTESHTRSINSSENGGEREKINLDNLIITGTLKDFVKNNIQSRSFQQYLAKASNEDIDKIIEALKVDFVDLMTH